jgi:hypothetical protein
MGDALLVLVVLSAPFAIGLLIGGLNGRRWLLAAGAVLGFATVVVTAALGGFGNGDFQSGDMNPGFNAFVMVCLLLAVEAGLAAGIRLRPRILQTRLFRLPPDPPHG